jgi:hypothetical protein
MRNVSSPMSIQQTTMNLQQQQQQQPDFPVYSSQKCQHIQTLKTGHASTSYASLAKTGTRLGQSCFHLSRLR